MTKKKKKAEKDFAKVKLKVGKKLKKPTATDTRFKTKKVLLLEQLAANTKDTVLSYRGLSLDELCRQLGHYNVNVRRDAIIGVRQLLSCHSHLISRHLRILIPTIGRLIADEKSDTATHAQLRALLMLLCNHCTSRTMSSYFALLIAHTLRALTHLKLAVRVFATSVLIILMQRYPDLCLACEDLFETFLIFMASNRKPSNKQLLLDAVRAFMSIFSAAEPPKQTPLHVGTFSIQSARVTRIDLTPPPHLFGLFAGARSSDLVTFDSTDRFLSTFNALCPFVVTLISDEKRPFMEETIEILSKLTDALNRIRQQTVPANFESTLNKTAHPLFMLIKNSHLPPRLIRQIEAFKTPISTDH